MSDEQKRPGCLTLNLAYDWYSLDRQKVVKYVEWLEAEIERKDKVFNDLVQSRGIER